MNPLFQAALDIQQTMKDRKWPFCFIGGLAVIRWGEMRMTQDIDLCLLCGFGNEEKYIEELAEQYKSRIDDPLTFAVTNRVLLLYASNGVAVDISLSGLPFEDEMIRRATPFLFYPDCSLITCSAEDLIVLKAFAERSKRLERHRGNCNAVWGGSGYRLYPRTTDTTLRCKRIT